MNGLHGIIFSYEQEPGLRELAERRMPASIPFGGRYRVVDFMLSNLHAAGITDIGVVLHGNYQSLLDHIGNGKTWDMARSTAGCVSLPPFADTRAYRSGEFRGKMEALAGVRSYLQGIRQDYVSSPTATLSSICRSRTCLPRIWRAARTSPPSARRTAACGQRDLPHARERRRDRADLVRADRAARPPLAGDLHSQQAAAAHARGRVPAQDKYSFRRDVLAGMTGRLKLRSRLGRLRRPAPLRAGVLRPLDGAAARLHPRRAFAAARPILAKEDDEASSLFRAGQPRERIRSSPTAAPSRAAWRTASSSPA